MSILNFKTPPPSAPTFRRSYAMHGAIAAGGMATVHVGRLLGPSGEPGSDLPEVPGERARPAL